MKWNHTSQKCKNKLCSIPNFHGRYCSEHRSRRQTIKVRKHRFKIANSIRWGNIDALIISMLPENWADTEEMEREYRKQQREKKGDKNE